MFPEPLISKFSYPPSNFSSFISALFLLFWHIFNENEETAMKRPVPYIQKTMKNL